MTIKNTPDVDDVFNNPDLLKDLPPAVLMALTDGAKQLQAKGSFVAKAITGELERRYSAHIAGAYQAAQKDTGTVHVFDGDFDIEVNRPKKIEWDQAVLKAVQNKIAAGGDNPAEYIKAELTVEEKKYAAWPEHIRKVFEPARTLKPGTMTIKLSMKEAA